MRTIDFWFAACTVSVRVARCDILSISWLVIAQQVDFSRPTCLLLISDFFPRSSSCGLAPQVVIGQKSRSAKLTACRTSCHASLSADRSRSFWKAVHIFSRHIQFCEEPFTAVKAHLPKNYCVHGAYKVAINQDSPSSLTTHATYVSRTINWRHGSLTRINRCGRVIV